MTGFFNTGGGEPEMEGMQPQHQQQQTHNNPVQPSMGGGRRRRGSRRSRRGRKGRGGYLTEVLSSAALLGATQFAKGRANYGYTGKNNYGSRKRRSSRRSRRSRRSSSRR